LIAAPSSSGLSNLGRIDPLARDAVFLASPFVEVNQLAAFSAEGAPRVVVPFDLLSASWTFGHEEKVRRKGRKVKASAAIAQYHPHRGQYHPRQRMG